MDNDQKGMRDFMQVMTDAYRKGFTDAIAIMRESGMLEILAGINNIRGNWDERNTEGKSAEIRK